MKITSSNRSEIRSRLLARASLAGLASVSAFIHAPIATHSAPMQSENGSHSLTVESFEEQDDKEAAQIKRATLALRRTDDETREEREIGTVSRIEIESETLAQGLAISESACLLSRMEKRKLRSDLTEYRIAQDSAQWNKSKARGLWLVLA